ncbi:hypothetical protein BJ322DRAFT_1063544 [Thelephora terrestris]|uniref:Uncharacterized protein n=1 Tax=Thelephora terrestris TaxID=56493 RepID=A0A9P6HHL9_9AGAM|nr:hypothetical protein BJ322DRAFT_1063544 [Thelephora terrestris]
MYPPLDSSPLTLPTIPDMTLLALGQLDDRYQPELSDIASAPTDAAWWCTESSNSLSEALQFSSTARLSPLSEPEAQSPMTWVVRQKRNVDSLPSGTYPYTRPEAKKDVDGVKRRKVWDHMFERRLFSPEELNKMKAQERRKVYVSSLEAHVDALHAQLLESKLYPVSLERLEKIHGVRSKTVVSMIGGIGHDVQKIKIRLEELQRDNGNLRLQLDTRRRLAQR